jgi:hypothetical protein
LLLEGLLAEDDVEFAAIRAQENHLARFRTHSSPVQNVAHSTSNSGAA